MAWGLEARVPFLDKAFLEVAMKIDPKHKEFGKGAAQTVDEDGKPKMEKVRCSLPLSSLFSSPPPANYLSPLDVRSTSSERRLTATDPTASPTFPTRSSGVKRSNSPTASATLGSTA
jgi:hypothetical protein